jgi:DNA-binding transcriptional MerR regulator
MSANKSNPQGQKLPTRALCERYGVSSKTIDRWLETGVIPQPLRINRYRYWDLDELEASERKLKSAQETAA